MAGVLRPYARVLSTPGARAFTTAGLIGRLPLSMISLSVVLLVTSQGRSYATAGTIAAAFALAAAVGGPVVSGFVDRHGQHRILPWAAACYAAFMAALLVALDRQAPMPLVLVLAAGAGVLMPSMGSLVRARWAYVLKDASGIHVAYAWESILDEVVFVVGPPLATVLALQLHPASGLVACALLVVLGAALLTPQRRTEPPPHAARRHRAGTALFNQGMPALVVVFIFVGGVFGSFEVVTVAFAQSRDAESATGVLLAVYAVGSLLAGLIYGARRSPSLHSRRLNLTLTLMAVVTIGFPLSSTVAMLGPVAFLAGLSVSPVLISGTALVERIVPAAQLTEGITWTTTGMALGLAVAAPVSGVIIDSRGPQTAYLVTAGCAIAACLVGWVAARRLRSGEKAAMHLSQVSDAPTP